MWQATVTIVIFTIIFSGSVRPTRSDDKLHSLKNQEIMQKKGKNTKIRSIYGNLKVIEMQINVANRIKKNKRETLNLKPTAPFCNEDYDYVVCRCPKTGRVKSKY